MDSRRLAWLVVLPFALALSINAIRVGIRGVRRRRMANRVTLKPWELTGRAAVIQGTMVATLGVALTLGAAYLLWRVVGGTFPQDVAP